MKRTFTLVIERTDDGWYSAAVPELPGCHAHATSLDALRAASVQAISAMLSAGAFPPGVDFVGVEAIDVEA